MSNVVALKVKRKAPLRPATSEAFERAWLAFPETGRHRSSRIEAWPQWLAVASDIGEMNLFGAVVRYAAQDREHKRDCGAPGFHRWLKSGRWEHWLDVAIQIPASPPAAKTFPDAELREAFHARFTDDRPRRWFDRCGWDEKSREVINDGTFLKAEWVQGPFRRWAEEHRVNALKLGAR